MTYTAGEPFTPFVNLTKAQVLGWVWAAGVSETDTQTALDAMIAAQVTPATVTINNPFPN